MRIIMNNCTKIVDTSFVTRDINVIICSVNGTTYSLGVYHGMRLPNNKTMTCEKVAQEVMISMAEYFEQFPGGTFFMPSQEEIEARIIEGEEEEC